MKRQLKLTLTFFISVLLSFSSYSFVHSVPPNTSHAISDLPTMMPSPFAGMTIKEFLSLTPRKYKELSGKRLSLSQKLNLRIAQYKIKRMIRKNKQLDAMVIGKALDGNDFHIPGFIIGIVLGPVGVLIAYLIEGKNSAMFQWAIIGALIWLGLFLLVVLIL